MPLKGTSGFQQKLEVLLEGLRGLLRSSLAAASGFTPPLLSQRSRAGGQQQEKASEGIFETSERQVNFSAKSRKAHNPPIIHSQFFFHPHLNSIYKISHTRSPFQEVCFCLGA